MAHCLRTKGSIEEGRTSKPVDSPKASFDGSDLTSRAQDDTDRPTPDWNNMAKSRVATLLDETRYPEDGNGPTLPEVIRDRIWPFYSNWLHGPLGPCTRAFKFERSADGDITSVTIYIISKQLPDNTLQEINKEHTLALVPKQFKSNSQVVSEFGEGTSTS